MHRFLSPIYNSPNRINAETALSEQCYGPEFIFCTMMQKKKKERKKLISVGLYKLLCLKAKEPSTAVWLMIQGLIVAQ